MTSCCGRFGIELPTPHHPRRRPAMRDLLTDALGSPAGQLAEILVRKVGQVAREKEFPNEVRLRLDRLMSATGRYGVLARVRLACEVSMFFDRVPNWTKEKMVPLFDWASAGAPDVWSA